MDPEQQAGSDSVVSEAIQCYIDNQVLQPGQVRTTVFSRIAAISELALKGADENADVAVSVGKILHVACNQKLTVQMFTQRLAELTQSQ